MEFRPVTLELMTHCSKTQFCRECSLRIGCKQRYNFYLESQEEFEIWLQTTEIQMNAVLNAKKIRFCFREHICSDSTS